MRSRTLLGRLNLLGALAIGTLGVCRPAQAGLPPLVVHRTEDSSDCPDALALADAVARQMKRPALDPAAEARGHGLDVQIYRSLAGYTAVVEANGKTRQLSDRGPTCAGLAAALAVSIAVMLDTEPLPPEPEPPPAPPAPELPPAPPAVVPPPAPPEAPAPVEPPPAAPLDVSAPPPPDDERPTVGRRFHVALAVGPAVTDGLLHGFAAGVEGELELRFGRFSVGGGALALPGQTYAFAPGQVHLDLVAGYVRGCGALIANGDSLRLALCAAPYAGVVRGVGSGYPTDNRSASQAWAAAGASLLFDQRIWGPIGWGARAELVIPLLKTSLLVENVGEAFTPSPVGGAFDVDLRLTIW